MSGGHFEYQQYSIDAAADELGRYIERVIDDKDYDYKDSTIQEFWKGYQYLKLAAIYLQRIDWLICDDDDEDTFAERLAEDLAELERGTQ